MSADDPYIMPPRKPGLPAERHESTPQVYDDRMPRPSGVVSSGLTGLGARWQARAYREIAENIRAQKDALDAETARRDSTMKLLRKTGELLDIKEILALDKAERAAQRIAKYEKLEDDRDERAHQRELAKLRRERELQDAQRALVESKRGVFNSEQGLENQERKKQVLLEMWEKRAAAQRLDAEKIMLLLNREVEDIRGKEGGADENLDQLVGLRGNLERAAHEAAASGDVAKSEKYMDLAKQLDDLVVAAMTAGAAKEGPG